MQIRASMGGILLLMIALPIFLRVGIVAAVQATDQNMQEPSQGTQATNQKKSRKWAKQPNSCTKREREY